MVFIARIANKMPFVLLFALRANSRASRLLRSRPEAGPLGCCADPAGRRVSLDWRLGAPPLWHPLHPPVGGLLPCGAPVLGWPAPPSRRVAASGDPARATRGGDFAALRSCRPLPTPGAPQRRGEGMGALPPVRPNAAWAACAPWTGAHTDDGSPGRTFSGPWAVQKIPPATNLRFCRRPPSGVEALHSGEWRGLRRRGSAGPIGSCQWLPLRPVGLRSGLRRFAISGRTCGGGLGDEERWAVRCGYGAGVPGADPASQRMRLGANRGAGQCSWGVAGCRQPACCRWCASKPTGFLRLFPS